MVTTTDSRSTLVLLTIVPLLWISVTARPQTAHLSTSGSHVSAIPNSADSVKSSRFFPLISDGNPYETRSGSKSVVSLDAMFVRRGLLQNINIHQVNIPAVGGNTSLAGISELISNTRFDFSNISSSNQGVTLDISSIQLQTGLLPYQRNSSGGANLEELVVLRIVILYASGATVTTSIANVGNGSSSYPLTNHTLQLSAGEFITEVSGQSGFVVNQLTLSTSIGRVWGPFGGYGGSAFNGTPSDSKERLKLYNLFGNEQDAFFIGFSPSYRYLSSVGFGWDLMPLQMPTLPVPAPQPASSGDQTAGTTATTVTAVAVSVGIVATTVASITTAPAAGMMAAAAAVGGGAGAGAGSGAVAVTSSSTAGAAVMAFILDLQQFSILSASSAHLDSLFSNLFGGLSWLNFQVYMGVNRGLLVNSQNISTSSAQGNLKLWQYDTPQRREAVYNIAANRLVAITVWLSLIAVLNWLCIRFLWSAPKDKDSVRRIFHDAENKLKSDLDRAKLIAVMSIQTTKRGNAKQQPRVRRGRKQQQGPLEDEKLKRGRVQRMRHGCHKSLVAAVAKTKRVAGQIRACLRAVPTLLAWPRSFIIMLTFIVTPLGGASGMLLAAGGASNIVLGLFVFFFTLVLLVSQMWLLLLIYHKRGPEGFNLTGDWQPDDSWFSLDATRHLSRAKRVLGKMCGKKEAPRTTPVEAEGGASHLQTRITKPDCQDGLQMTKVWQEIQQQQQQNKQQVEREDLATQQPGVSHSKPEPVAEGYEGRNTTAGRTTEPTALPTGSHGITGASSSAAAGIQPRGRPVDAPRPIDGPQLTAGPQVGVSPEDHQQDQKGSIQCTQQLEQMEQVWKSLDLPNVKISIRSRSPTTAATKASPLGSSNSQGHDVEVKHPEPLHVPGNASELGSNANSLRQRTLSQRTQVQGADGERAVAATQGVSSLLGHLRVVQLRQEEARKRAAEASAEKRQKDIEGFLERMMRGEVQPGGAPQPEPEVEEQPGCATNADMVWVHEAEMYKIPEPLRSYCFRSAGMGLGHLLYLLSYTKPTATVPIMHRVGSEPARQMSMFQKLSVRHRTLLSQSSAFLSSFHSGHNLMDIINKNEPAPYMIPSSDDNATADGHAPGEECSSPRATFTGAEDHTEIPVPVKEPGEFPGTAQLHPELSPTEPISKMAPGQHAQGKASEAPCPSQPLNLIDEQFIITREIFERFGSPFELYKPDTFFTFSYEAVRSWRNFMVSFLTGVQQGGGLAPGTAAAQAVIFVVVVANVALMYFVLYQRPFRSSFNSKVEMATCIFAVASTALLFALAFNIVDSIVSHLQTALLATSIIGALINLINSLLCTIQMIAQIMNPVGLGMVTFGNPVNEWGQAVQSGMLGGGAELGNFGLCASNPNLPFDALNLGVGDVALEMATVPELPEESPQKKQNDTPSEKPPQQPVDAQLGSHPQQQQQQQQEQKQKQQVGMLPRHDHLQQWHQQQQAHEHQEEYRRNEKQMHMQ